MTAVAPPVVAVKEEVVMEEFVPSSREFYNPTLDFQGYGVGRSDTPNTMLQDFPHRPGPDISLLCEYCRSFVQLRLLKEHRYYHKALKVLKYNSEVKPQTADALLKRRKAVLRKMKSASTQEKPVTSEAVKTVNEAYEYLKANLDGTYEELHQVREDVDVTVSGVALNCSNDIAFAVGIAESENERWKSTMEDSRVFQDNFGDDPNKCYLGLFDGYHGRFAAEVAASELHKILLYEMIKFDPWTKTTSTSSLAGYMDFNQFTFSRPNTTESERVVLYTESIDIIQNIINVCEAKYNEMIRKCDKTPENVVSTDRKKKDKNPFAKKMESAFSKVYYLLDILLSYGKDEHSRIRWSGCSALTVVIEKLREEEIKEEEEADNVSVISGELDPPRQCGVIHLANAGNTHAVLVRGNRAYKISKDHTPNNAKERNRVLRDGGTLSDSSTQCRVNGVIQTTRGLGNHGDKALKKCVLVEPYTTSVPVDQYAQFIILATRGVWEVFSEKEAASLLIKLLPSNQVPAPGKVSCTLKPLLEQLSREPSSMGRSSRRVSFSSVESPIKMADTEGERPRSSHRKLSPILRRVSESKGDESRSPITEGQDSARSKKSESSHTEVIKSARSQRSNLSSEVASIKSSNQAEEQEPSSQEVLHSTPTLSSKQGSSGKHIRKYLDTDMQTEVGSHYGDEYSDDSGNEADVDTYMENMSSGRLSGISITGGPPTKEQIRRDHAKYMAEHLVQAALLAGAKSNATVMVVLLPGSGL